MVSLSHYILLPLINISSLFFSFIAIFRLQGLNLFARIPSRLGTGNPKTSQRSQSLAVQVEPAAVAALARNPASPQALLY